MFGAAVLQPGSHEFGNCKSEEQLAKSFLCYPCAWRGLEPPVLETLQLKRKLLRSPTIVKRKMREQCKKLLLLSNP